MLTRQGAMMRIAPSTTVRMLSFTENPVVFVRAVLFEEIHFTTYRSRRVVRHLDMQSREPHVEYSPRFRCNGKHLFNNPEDNTHSPPIIKTPVNANFCPMGACSLQISGIGMTRIRTPVKTLIGETTR
jgi:hypothetical protein